MEAETLETVTGKQVFVRLTDKEILTTIIKLAKLLQENYYSLSVGKINFIRTDYVKNQVEMEKD